MAEGVNARHGRECLQRLAGLATSNRPYIQSKDELASAGPILSRQEVEVHFCVGNRNADNLVLSTTSGTLISSNHRIKRRDGRSNSNRHTLCKSVAILPSSGLKPRRSPSSTAGFVNTLMPQPSQISIQEGRLVITPSFKTATDHFRDARLDAAIARSLGRIKNRSGIPIPTSPDTDGRSATLLVSVDGAGAAIQSIDEDESYSLEITSSSAHLRRGDCRRRDARARQLWNS